MRDDKICCPICKSRDLTKFWAMSGYKLARCRTCGMVWDYFPPENLLFQYSESYFNNDNPKGGYANYFEGMVVNKKTFSDRLKKIERKFGKGKLLDVGCALGDSLLEARRLGWKETEGLEVSEYAYRFAKKRRLKVTRGHLRQDTFDSNTFDIVTYQDVIEHIADPVGELKKVFRILKPGGIIYIVTPDIGGFWARLLGPMWYHYKPIEHVSYFSQKTIRKALNLTGFINLETYETYHVLSLEYIINRMRWYIPFLFEAMLKIIRVTPFRDLTFKPYTGELEAWGQKPM